VTDHRGFQRDKQDPTKLKGIVGGISGVINKANLRSPSCLLLGIHDPLQPEACIEINAAECLSPGLVGVAVNTPGHPVQDDTVFVNSSTPFPDASLDQSCGSGVSPRIAPGTALPQG
jgi:hypothetical protein